jgi:hypothetical protein
VAQSELVTPVAVVAGAVLVAAAVWSGLGRIAEAIAEASRSAPPALVKREPAPSVPAPPAAQPAANPETPDDWQNRLRDEAQIAFTKQREDYVRACWKPKPPAAGQAPDFGGGFELELRFDASGREIARKVSSAGTAGTELAECVRELRLPALRVPAPGREGSATVVMPIP